MMANRSETITAKVSSRVGSYYLHLQHCDGKVTGISISSPGRYVDTVVGELMIAIGETATEIIEQIGGRE